MTHYCAGCGGWGLLDKITFWCQVCTRTWERAAAAAREKSAP